MGQTTYRFNLDVVTNNALSEEDKVVLEERIKSIFSYANKSGALEEDMSDDAGVYSVSLELIDSY